MRKVYGLSLKPNSKIYYYSFSERLEENEKVIIDSDNGEQIANVVKLIKNPGKDLIIKEIVRKATKKDLEQDKKNRIDAQKAVDKAKELVLKHNLSMNILKAEYTLDRSKLQFNFLADERVDFRELAKSLAAIYKVRIELHQIGVRDKAREIGGIGQCGRCLCCKGFLKDIGSISINSVKNQNIAINPSKINGQCGRLLCCLTYEDDEYTKCQKGMPHVGEIVNTEYGNGKVISVDILNRTYKVDINGNKKEIRLSECEKCSSK